MNTQTRLFDDFDRSPIPADVLAQRAAVQPALAARPDEFVTRPRAGTTNGPVLVPLHHLALAGDRHAARVVLVALGPSRRRCPPAHHTEDRVEVVDETISCLFEAVVTPHPR